MSNLFWLTDVQMARLQPFFPKSHGKPRVDDRRVLPRSASALSSAARQMLDKPEEAARNAIAAQEMIKAN